MSHTTIPEDYDFFLEHAFFFLANAPRILSDKKMSLAQIPISNGLAYSGLSGFGNPTLGVYLEWWLTTPCSIYEEEGKKYLIWKFAGSPLSGINICRSVDEAGNTHAYSTGTFRSLWENFMAINAEYKTEKQSVDPYSLEEVYERLGGEQAEGDSRIKLLVNNVFLRSRISDLQKQLERTIAELSSVKAELTETKIKANETLLREAYQEYQERDIKRKQRIAELHEQRRDLKSKLKSAIIDNHQYQREFRQIREELYGLNNNPFPDIVEKIRPTGLDLSTIIAHFDDSKASNQQEKN